MHIKNYNKAQKGHILTHNENADVRSRLKHVDKDKTSLNYNLCPRDVSAIDYWQERFNQSKHSNQKKTTVMTDIVLTEPKGLTDEQSKQFFKESYGFLAKRYGEDNICSAWVHCDEPDAQRHLHLCMLPINKETNRCSARGVFSKEELQAVHSDLQKHLDSSLDFKACVMNGATHGGNKTIQELKAESLAKENQALQKQLREEQIKLRFLQGELEQVKESNLREETRTRAIEERYTDITDRLSLEGENERLKAQLADAIPKADFDEVMEQYEKAYKLLESADAYFDRIGGKEDFINFHRARHSDIENDL